MKTTKKKTPSACPYFPYINLYISHLNTLNPSISCNRLLIMVMMEELMVKRQTVS